MRLLIMHKVQCVQSNVQVSDGDKLMLNYDSEQKKGKERSQGKKDVKRKTDLPLVTRTKSKKT